MIDAEDGALEDVSLCVVQTFHLKEEMPSGACPRLHDMEKRAAANSDRVEKRRRPITTMRTSCSVHATLEVAARKQYHEHAAVPRPSWKWRTIAQ